MKRKLVCGLLCSLGCGLFGGGNDPVEPTPDPTNKTTIDLKSMDTSGDTCGEDPLSDEFMKRVIGTLAQPAWEGRKFNSQGLVSAIAWAKKQFACVGLTPGASVLGINGFEQPFETIGDEVDRRGKTYVPDYEFDEDKKYKFTNLVGSIPGSGALANEVIVIGAHIDHLGLYGVEKRGDPEMVLGADDNASGILALLALSKSILSEPAPADRRTIVFVSFGIEEEPFELKGSIAFLAALTPEAKGKIVHYINFDMIGHYSDKGAVDALGTFPGTASRRLIEPIVAEQPELKVVLGDYSPNSDNATFCAAGIPYVYFWSENEGYHTASDIPESIDYKNMSQILKIATKLAQKLAVEPDLKSDKAAFPQNFQKAKPGHNCLE